MRIAVDGMAFGKREGVGNYLRNILLCLQKLDSVNQYHVIVNNPTREWYTLENPRFIKLETPRITSTPIGKILYQQTFIPMFLRSRKFDLLWIVNNPFVVFRPCPVVATIHDIGELHILNKYDRLRMFYRTKLMLPMTARNADAIITPSVSSKKDIVTMLGVPDERVIAIPLGVDHVFKPLPKEECRRVVRERYGKGFLPYILTVGRLDPHGKNLMRLVDAYHILRTHYGVGHRLVLAGGMWRRTEELLHHIRKLGLMDDVILPGYVPSDFLPVLYNACDIFVFPSLWEGFGLPLLEAMACGTASAISRIPSLMEVGQDAVVTFDPLNVYDIARTLQNLLGDSRLRANLAARAIEVAAGYSWDAVAKETLRVLERVGQSAGRPL